MTDDFDDVLDRCENCDKWFEEGTLRATEDDVLLCEKCWAVLVDGQLPLELRQGESK